MERKEFLRSLGAGAAFALTFPCLHGCSKDEVNGNLVEEPTGVDFTIDLILNIADRIGDFIAEIIQLFASLIDINLIIFLLGRS